MMQPYKIQFLVGKVVVFGKYLADLVDKSLKLFLSLS